MTYFDRQLLPNAHRWALYAILSVHGPRLGEDSTNYLEGAALLFAALLLQFVCVCDFLPVHRRRHYCVGLHQGYKFGLTIKKASQNIDLLVHRLLERADHDALSRQERETFGPRHANIDKYLKTRLRRAKAIFEHADHIELVDNDDKEGVRVRSDHDDNRT
jgi:hypothetical protein